MKLFEIPEIDVKKFEVEDVLTTSDPDDGLGTNGLPKI